MKSNWIKYLLSGLFLASIIACDRKNCNHTTCPAGLECVGDGQCVCEDGYEGPNCSTLSSTKYQYSWLVNNTCSDPNSSPTYTISILSCNNSSQINCITLNSFIDGQSIYALIENTSASNLGNTLYIPAQSAGSITVSASSGTYFAANTGNYAYPTIIINLNYVNGSNAYSCPITMTQQ